MGTMPEDAARGGAASAMYQECVQELQKSHPGYAKIQALAAVGLVAALRDVSGQVAELSHQVMLASRR